MKILSPICFNKNYFILFIGVLFMSCEDSLLDNSEEMEYIYPADWVELFNSTNESIDIGSWKFRDGNDTHLFIIPENQVLEAGEYLVLCEKSLAFNNNFPNVSNFIGEFNFGLKGGGELVWLFDADSNLIDSVRYDDNNPWPTEPDGNGPTLELIHPSLDNGLGENWAASDNNGGTPGMINSVYSADNSTSIASGIVINEINYNAPDD